VAISTDDLRLRFLLAAGRCRQNRSVGDDRPFRRATPARREALQADLGTDITATVGTVRVEAVQVVALAAVRVEAEEKLIVDRLARAVEKDGPRRVLPLHRELPPRPFVRGAEDAAGA